MAKAPAFQFYVKDWLCDPELRLASLLSRGAWIDCLCFMWENSQRGKLTATPLKFSRLISGSLDETLHFLNEINEYEFGDIEIEGNLKFPLTEADCNTKVTITNRRMYADHKDKQNTRLRVRKHREKKKVTPKKQKCNGDVTVTSPTPSPTPSPKIKRKYKKKNDFIRPYLGEFENVKLTSKEYEKLKIKFNHLYKDKIENLSIYLKSKGDKYKSHYATLLSWDRREQKEDNLQPKTYPQAQDAERRGRAKWLTEMGDDNQNDSDQRVDKVIPLLSGDQI